jgi:hypothetical protein
VVERWRKPAMHPCTGRSSTTISFFRFVVIIFLLPFNLDF